VIDDVAEVLDTPAPAAPVAVPPLDAPEPVKAAPDAKAEPSTWQKLTAGIRSMSEAVDAEAAKPDAAKDGEAPAGDDTTKEPVKPTAEQPDAAKKDEPVKVPAKAAYVVRDAEGEVPGGLDWPEGLEVVFKADKHPVAVTSMDQLVDLAQKGVFADRKIGEEVSARRTQAADFAAKEQTFRAKQKEAQDLLLDVVFDDDVREKVAEALADLKDPAARRVKELEAEREEGKTAEATKAQAAAAENEQAVIGQFWDAVDAQIETSLKDFPNLDPDDSRQIVSDFVALYDQDVAQLTTHHVRQGKSPADARALAERQATRVYTEANLKGVMHVLNAHIEKKVAPLRTAAARARDAVEHNAHVEKKITQRDASRPLRGTGSPPAPARPAPAEDGKKRNGFQRLTHSMKGALAELDED
jgi:hypothetical protein